MKESKPRFFRTQAELRRWFIANHAKAEDLVIRFYKTKTGKRSVTPQEALDEALCFGWIDGIRHGGEDTFTNRYTPRRPRSFWSTINIARVGELTEAGRMKPAGIAAFERRDQARTDRFVAERAAAKLTKGEENTIKANKKAWTFFQDVAPSYRRNVIHWIASARKPETRARRVATLIDYAARGKRVPPLTPAAKR